MATTTKRKPKSPRITEEMADFGSGPKPVKGGTSHIGRDKHPSKESRKTTGLPHHSPGSDGGHKRMEKRAQAPKGKRGRKRAGTK